ncbi:hypothetical protein KEJ19_04240, partial [Candidatus Bathyarchaeota archaeon]|nr:hypothetical protein [Candidatus Bathyarchaeota archaeon]
MPQAHGFGFNRLDWRKREKIAEVCRNLGITAIEHHTDEDKDVKPYIQPFDGEWRHVKSPEEYLAVRDK